MRIKLMKGMTSVMASEQNWPQLGLLSLFLWPLTNYFENDFCRQICGELKVPFFSKITIMTKVLIAKIGIKWELIPFSYWSNQRNRKLVNILPH